MKEGICAVCGGVGAVNQDLYTDFAREAGLTVATDSVHLTHCLSALRALTAAQPNSEWLKRD